MFHQFRSRLCPYFYLCTHQFTVLFCESAVAQSGIVAMVTPTTRGFRELLQTEGITLIYCGLLKHVNYLCNFVFFYKHHKIKTLAHIERRPGAVALAVVCQLHIIGPS